MQPDGSITVRVPVPNGWNVTDTAVYHIENNGTLTNMGAAASDDGTYVSFTTNHFSLFVLVNTASETEKPSEPDDGKVPDDGQKPDDGKVPDDSQKPDDGKVPDDGQKPDDGNTDNVPVQTGDTNSADVWVMVLVISAAAAAVLVIEKKKKGGKAK